MSTRAATVDVIRGVAVMGILAMNIVAFAMPTAAHFVPSPGMAEPRSADIWAWALAFIFIDGKMRGLFSLLFGASMLLMIDRAEADGLDSGSIHRRRMFWLLVFGLLHFFLIWWGDILTLYAAVGLAAYGFRAKSAKRLLGWSVAIFLVAIALWLLFQFQLLNMQSAAAMANADPQIVKEWQATEAGIGGTPESAAAEVSRYRGSYGGILEEKLTESWFMPIAQLAMFGPETLAFMLLGMWSVRSGFIVGAWESRRYGMVALAGLAISLPAYTAMAWLVHRSDYDPIAGFAASLGGGSLFRPVMTLAYAAIIVAIARRGADGWLGARVAAAGRAAFTNYLGTSLVATFIFYGWGLGLFGAVGRAELYLIVLAICLLMLLWSKPWLDRYRQGPLEWLWRSLVRGALQPFRLPGPATR